LALDFIYPARNFEVGCLIQAAIEVDKMMCVPEFEEIAKVTKISFCIILNVLTMKKCRQIIKDAIGA
jgi:hypothetical protein